MRKLYLLILFFVMLCSTTRAQQLEWDLNFHGFADNREYAKSGRYPQTIFGARIAPEIGLSVDSIHRLRAGANYLHEFGAKPVGELTPTVYYNYQQYGFNFYIGMFPRYGLLDDYPRAILNDTLLYYRPNVEGMLLRYANDALFQQVWIDWTSRQTDTDREQFMVGLSGKVHTNLLYFAHHVMLWHNAGPKVKVAGDQVRDNGAAMARIGINLSEQTFLDSLDINMGGIIGYDRLRGSYGWRTATGFITGLHAAYRNFFIDNTFFAGEPLDIPYGDRFYTAERYDRLELGWTPLRYKGLEGKFIASFHFTPGAVDNQQQFLLRYHIGGHYPAD